MKFYVGITDNSWFRFLSKQSPDEVNFWRPKNQNDFRAIGPGDLFLFKLHSPLNYIVGGGFLLKHEFLSLQMAWDTFGITNGTPDQDAFERAILEHRSDAERSNPLGCTILVEPFFWPDTDWIEVPSDWSGNIVTGKTYDTNTEIGRNLWSDVQLRLRGRNSINENEADDPTSDRYGKPHLVKPRLGQGAFRISVINIYNRRCAVTGERTLPALEASHIKPYSRNGPHDPTNGILLRSDLHNLFDQGYLTITPDYRLEVSRRIKEEFDNGRHYYALQGHTIALPSRSDVRPDQHHLEWHRNNLFKG
ncbi:MAG: HNH endonuclease [Opitutaceae bacterium]|nr:HNH endonuclease [Opitutaceae bacterium]